MTTPSNLVVPIATNFSRINAQIMKKPSIIKPHVKVKTICDINFLKIKEMGMNKLIFGKLNVLTHPDTQHEGFIN